MIPATAIGVLVLLVLGALLYRYGILKNPLDMFGWGPPWDFRFVPGIVLVLVLIVWFLAPHSQLAKTVSDLISGWFR